MRIQVCLRGISVLALVTLVGVCGCTPAPVAAKGQLTWDDGKPIDGANLRFIPVSGGPEAVGSTDKDGAFTLLSGAAGAAPGEYKVVVTKMATSGKGPTTTPTFKDQPSPEELSKMMQEAYKKQGKMPPAQKSEIPEIYTSEKTTPLTAKVESSGKAIELKLSKKG